MFGRLRQPPIQAQRTTTVAPDSTVWAIGDIHGQDDLFDALAMAVEEDAATDPSRHRMVVLLGDYIDRGLGAARVIDRIFRLRSALEEQGAELVMLKGNHEALLLNFIDHPETGPAWMAVGGSETLLSYGIQPPLQHDLSSWTETSNRLLMEMPLEHLIFYEELPYHHQEGDYHFVHAGVRFGIALEEQAQEDMLWIRDSFLKDTRPFDKMIVHGHTPGADVYSDHRRICLDTGSYATGVLTALRLQGSDRELLQARRGRGKVRVQRLALDEDKAGAPGQAGAHARGPQG